MDIIFVQEIQNTFMMSVGRAVHDGRVGVNMLAWTGLVGRCCSPKLSAGNFPARTGEDQQRASHTQVRGDGDKPDLLWWMEVLLGRERWRT